MTLPDWAQSFALDGTNGGSLDYLSFEGRSLEGPLHLRQGHSAVAGRVKHRELRLANPVTDRV